MRRIWILLACLLLVMGSMAMSVSAATTRSAASLIRTMDTRPLRIRYTQKEKKEIIQEQKEVAQSLQQEGSLSEMDPEEMDQLVKEVLTEEYEDAADLVEEKIEDSADNPSCGIDSNLPEKTYDLDDQTSVTFRENLVQIDILEEEPETRPSRGRKALIGKLARLVAEPCYAASDEKSKKASCKTIIYDAHTGWKCFTVYVKARFTYSKSARTCTVSTLSHYAKKSSPATIFSSVHDTEYTVEKPSKKSRTCRQSGYIRTGVTIKGVGLVTSDYYACAALTCNYKGKITKDRCTA